MFVSYMFVWILLCDFNETNIESPQWIKAHKMTNMKNKQKNPEYDSFRLTLGARTLNF